MRPELLDRRMLEGLKEIDGHRPETRMAWGRDHGWFFFGPGQVQCWMVADLTHWHVTTAPIKPSGYIMDVH